MDGVDDGDGSSKRESCDQSPLAAVAPSELVLACSPSVLRTIGRNLWAGRV